MLQAGAETHDVCNQQASECPDRLRATGSIHDALSICRRHFAAVKNYISVCTLLICVSLDISVRFSFPVLSFTKFGVETTCLAADSLCSYEAGILIPACTEVLSVQSIPLSSHSSEYYCSLLCNGIPFI